MCEWYRVTVRVSVGVRFRVTVNIKVGVRGVWRLIRGWDSLTVACDGALVPPDQTYTGAEEN